jgi:hypothetical protein
MQMKSANIEFAEISSEARVVGFIVNIHTSSPMIWLSSATTFKTINVRASIASKNYSSFLKFDQLIGPSSRFLHYSIEDEEHYRMYGEFPIGQEDFGNGNQNNQANIQQQQQQVEYQSELNSFFNGSSSSGVNRSLPSLLDGDLFHSCQQRHESCCHSDRGFSNGNSVFRNGLKRLNSQDRDCMQQKFKRCREDDIMTVLRRFDEEHQMLKRRVEANELKIAELRASNEYLMTQNAQLRMATVQVSRVVNPVTVTQTQSQQQSQGPQLISAQCHSQLVTTPIVSMATPQTQIIATPQNMSGAPTLALTNTSQPTQQILGTTQQITLAPAALAPSISTPINTISINTSQALQAAISNATQPIISYPIMTHSILPH